MSDTTDLKATESDRLMFGEELIWLFILGDMCVFTLFFFVYGYARTEDADLFRTSQQTLNIHYGSINTLILLASSWLVVLAVRFGRTQNNRAASHALIGASLLGTGFAILKVIEYGKKASEGISFETDAFFLFYYLLTGLHFAHLLTGIFVLLYFAYVFRKPKLTPVQFSAFESGAIFWHMIDLLWIIIFPLLYLLP
jgi:nitric oxide reductase NorE protein